VFVRTTRSSHLLQGANLIAVGTLNCSPSKGKIGPGAARGRKGARACASASFLTPRDAFGDAFSSWKSSPHAEHDHFTRAWHCLGKCSVSTPCYESVALPSEMLSLYLMLRERGIALGKVATGDNFVQIRSVLNKISCSAFLKGCGDALTRRH
jgi:hypothetical protein